MDLMRRINCINFLDLPPQAQLQRIQSERATRMAYRDEALAQPVRKTTKRKTSTKKSSTKKGPSKAVMDLLRGMTPEQREALLKSYGG